MASPAKMLPSICNILKPHPINLKANLQKICSVANIKFETNEIRPLLMDKITEFASKDTSNEAYVRKMVSDINEEFRKTKNSLSNVPSNCENETMVLDDTQTDSETQNSQFSLFDTQDSNEKANIQSKENRTTDLKRRHERDENDDDLVLKKAKPDNENDSLILELIKNINAVSFILY